MSAGMAEVIAEHSGHSVKLSPQGRFTAQCHGCGESTSVSRVTPPRSGSPIHAAHVAEELAKAGYGKLGEARAVAWDYGFEDGWSEARNPGAFVNDVWDAKTPNPYREPQHG